MNHATKMIGPYRIWTQNSRNNRCVLCWVMPINELVFPIKCCISCAIWKNNKISAQAKCWKKPV